MNGVIGASAGSATGDDGLDFAASDAQRQLADLARRVLTDAVTIDRLRAIEASASGWDDELWAVATELGLLSIGLPEALGGGGFGPLEAATVALEAGRALVPLPVADAMASAAALAAGPPALQRWAAAAATGTAVVVTAPDGLDGTTATTGVRFDPTATTATGTIAAAAHPTRADRLVAVARAGVRPAVVLVDPRRPGVRVVPLTRTSGLRVDEVRLDAVAIDPDEVVVGADASELIGALRAHAIVLAAAEAVGLAEATLALTASYVTERHQFGRALGSFQAVAARAADCYIDVQAMTWTMWRAAHELALAPSAPNTADAIEVARVWACDGGHRVASSALHLHGGIGVDLDYPLHRYFLRSKQLELSLGGGAAHLATLGRQIADRALSEVRP